MKKCRRESLNLFGNYCRIIKFLNGLEMLNLVFGYIGDCNVWKGLVIGWCVFFIWKVCVSISIMWNIMVIFLKWVLRIYCFCLKLRNGIWINWFFFIRRLVFSIFLF